jgi:hypothetical protein
MSRKIIAKQGLLKGWISVRIAECYISERKYQPDEPKGLFSGNRGKRKNQKYSYLKNFFHKRSLILFWPNQLRRLLIVVLLPGNALHLGLEVAKQVFNFDGTIRFDDVFILDPFEHEVGKESVSFFIIGRAYLVVRRS